MDYIDINLYFKENLPFFKDLSESELKYLLSKSSIQKYDKDTIIYSKNSSCTGIVLVLDGQIRSFMSSDIGREITLFRLFERDICMLSSSCVYQNLSCEINLKTEKNSSVIIIDGEALKKVANNNIHVQSFLLDLTQNKLSEIMWVLEQVVFFKLETRVADFLIANII